MKYAPNYQHDVVGSVVGTGKVEGNRDVHEHEQGRGLHGATVTRDGEQFQEFAARLLVDLLLRLKQHMDICTPQ